MEAGSQESVGWQGQAKERGRPAEAGMQTGGKQAEMGGHRHEAARQAGRVTKAGRGGSRRAERSRQ
jgi:hypothetical protein